MKRVEISYADVRGSNHTWRIAIGSETGEEVLRKLRTQAREGLKTLRLKRGGWICLQEPLCEQLREHETQLEAYREMNQTKTGDPIVRTVYQEFHLDEDPAFPLLACRLGDKLEDFGGRMGWKFCRAPSGALGFVPDWVFDRRPLGAVRRVDALRSSLFVDSLIFQLRDGSKAGFGTDGFFNYGEELEEDEAILEVVQMEEGNLCVEIRVKTTKRDLVITSLDKSRGRSSKKTFRSQPDRQICGLHVDPVEKHRLVAIRHQRLYPRLIKRHDKQMKCLRRRAIEDAAASPPAASAQRRFERRQRALEN